MTSCRQNTILSIFKAPAIVLMTDVAVRLIIYYLDERALLKR